MPSLTPALFTRASRWPKNSPALFTARRHSSGRQRSAATNLVRSWPNSRTSLAPASSSRSAITGMPPSWLAARQIAAPIPLPPPVTRITLSLSCKSIKSRCVQAKDPVLFVLRQSLGVIGNDFLHLTVTARQQAHGPVRTKHEPVASKTLEHHIQVRFKVAGPPPPPVGFRYHAGKLAVDVGKGGHSPHPVLPASDFFNLDLRFGDVIHNEFLFRKPCRKLHCRRELPGVNQDVVGEAEGSQFGDATQKISSQQEAL